MLLEQNIPRVERLLLFLTQPNGSIRLPTSLGEPALTFCFANDLRRYAIHHKQKVLPKFVVSTYRMRDGQSLPGLVYSNCGVRQLPVIRQKLPGDAAARRAVQTKEKRAIA
jgi:hypothetical protein